MTIETLNKKVEAGELKKLHTSLFRGYVSRVSGPDIEPYTGKFGTGYVMLSPNWESTRYSFVTYYVEEP